MPKYNTKGRSRRVKNLMVITTLSALLLAISTYAWFVGMRSVHVEAFQVEIAATDSLLLSFDGENFHETVHISEDILKEVSYSGHTNKWSNLIPVSSIGQMDVESSRMVLFEKASLTASRGGFRLLASRVNNFKAEGAENSSNDHEGYVVFDLFIKNYSGNHYIDILDIRDEEAIYLTTDSKVEIAQGGVPNTGIENSVRVAFAQIGRVNEQETKEDAERITGITCTDSVVEGKANVTGICRTAQIWEPNDRDHVDGAINWYKESCKLRKTDGYDVMKDASFTEDSVCSDLEKESEEVDAVYKYYPTYAVSKAFTSATNPSSENPHVDIYDGSSYNGFGKTITTIGDSGFNLRPIDYEEPGEGEGSGEGGESGDGVKYLELNNLTAYPYFTDSDKVKTGTEREAFMYLAPNSVTKVRVYIYIEGQDIDNYDFAQIGKKISIKFGFTKERFTPGDIEYGETAPTLDFEKPVIKLYNKLPTEEPENPGVEVGKKDGKYSMEIDLDKEESFAHPHIMVDNEVVESSSENIDIDGDTELLSGTPSVGTHVVYYRASDEAGNWQTEILVVNVKKTEEIDG